LASSSRVPDRDVGGNVLNSILVAGNIVVDILTRPIEHIRWDATTWVESIEQSLGGNGANTSFALGRLGVGVRLLGAVGSDSFGDFALRRLREAGVDVSGVTRVDESTAATTVLVRPDGARALLHRPGASRRAFADIPDFAASGSQHFHLANIYGLPLLRPHAGRALAAARAARLTTSLDTGWDSLGEWMAIAEPCLPHLDYLFVNQDEARMLAGTDDPAKAAALFRSRGVHCVIVKLGEAGCAVFSDEGEIRVPAFDVSVVDTTGAGDCFAGGFLARRVIDGASLQDSARFANAVGALAVQALGATTGVASREATEQWIRTARVSTEARP
jgi:sugar/nucleoside kinase (ribokinase family)